MKTPETPFIGPRPRQSFAARKVALLTHLWVITGRGVLVGGRRG